MESRRTSPTKLNKLPADPLREALLESDYLGIISYCASSKMMNLIYSPCSRLEFWASKVERERDYGTLSKFVDDIVKHNGSRILDLILTNNLLSEDEKNMFFTEIGITNMVIDGKISILKVIFDNRVVSYSSMFSQHGRDAIRTVNLFETRMLVLQDQELMDAYIRCVKDEKSQEGIRKGTMFDIIMMIYGLGEEWVNLNLSIYPNAFLNAGMVEEAAFLISDCVAQFSSVFFRLRYGEEDTTIEEYNIYDKQELLEILYLDQPSMKAKPNIFTKFTPFVTHLLTGYSRNENITVMNNWIKTGLLEHLYEHLDSFSQFIHSYISVGKFLEYVLSSDSHIPILIREANFFIENGFTFNTGDIHQRCLDLRSSEDDKNIDQKTNIIQMRDSIRGILVRDIPITRIQQKNLESIVERLNERAGM